jgi:hypothetical protein
MNVFTFIAAQPFNFSASSSESRAVKNRIFIRNLNRKPNRIIAVKPYKIKYSKRIEKEK